MGSNFNLATFIVGILSLCGVIINIIVTSINNKINRYTDLVTQRRLRTFKSIIDFSSNCLKAVYGVRVGLANDYELLQTFVENKLQIFYNINYKAPAEKELKDALNALHDLFENYVKNKDSLNKAEKEKICDTLKHGADYYQAISGVYCKSEWVRIKRSTLSAKDNVDTEKEYFERIKDLEKDTAKNKKILFENTFEKITKNSSK
ncbi:MAG: hypothetical protein MJ149_02245 [Clostridia bacterium]|nr:hypothetical protein [Clostridia bacterium]